MRKGGIIVDFNLQVGLNAERELMVSKVNTAKQYGSGAIEVFATPAMISLMEGASMDAVQSFLPEGFGTVGTSIQVNHVAATPIGMKVTAKAEVTQISGKRITFKIEAFDEVGLIGEGIHERYIIEELKFLERVASKGKNS